MQLCHVAVQSGIFRVALHVFSLNETLDPLLYVLQRKERWSTVPFIPHKPSCTRTCGVGENRDDNCLVTSAMRSLCPEVFLAFIVRTMAASIRWRRSSSTPAGRASPAPASSSLLTSFAATSGTFTLFLGILSCSLNVKLSLLSIPCRHPANTQSALRRSGFLSQNSLCSWRICAKCAAWECRDSVSGGAAPALESLSRRGSRSKSAWT